MPPTLSVHILRSRQLAPMLIPSSRPKRAPGVRDRVGVGVRVRARARAGARARARARVRVIVGRVRFVIAAPQHREQWPLPRLVRVRVGVGVRVRVRVRVRVKVGVKVGVRVGVRDRVRVRVTKKSLSAEVVNRLLKARDHLCTWALGLGLG